MAVASASPTARWMVAAGTTPGRPRRPSTPRSAQGARVEAPAARGLCVLSTVRSRPCAAWTPRWPSARRKSGPTPSRSGMPPTPSVRARIEAAERGGVGARPTSVHCQVRLGQSLVYHENASWEGWAAIDRRGVRLSVSAFLGSTVRAYRKGYPGSSQAQEGGASQPIFGRQSKKTRGPDTAFSFWRRFPKKNLHFWTAVQKNTRPWHGVLFFAKRRLEAVVCFKHGLLPPRCASEGGCFSSLR